MTDQPFLEATLPHLDVVWSIARRMASDAAAAEDLVQETYARAWRGFAGQGAGEVRAWLVAICLNVCRSELRRTMRLPRVVADLDATGDRPASDDVAEAAVAALERDAVVRALADLPAHHRRAIVLVDVGGLTAREAAEIERVPRGTMLARVHRGRRQLAALVEREGLRRGT